MLKQKVVQEQTESEQQSPDAEQAEQWLKEVWLLARHPQALSVLTAWKIVGFSEVARAMFGIVPRSTLECIFDDLNETGEKLSEAAGCLIAEEFDTWLYGMREPSPCPKQAGPYDGIVIYEELPDWLKVQEHVGIQARPRI